MENNDLMVKEEQQLATQTELPLGFEDDAPEDLLIPRIKLAQALSPEVKDGHVKMGDIFNSLSYEVLNDKVFIPVCKFNNHVWWRDRADGGGIICRAADGKVGVTEDGTTQYCTQCRKCEFDNTKQGREALPKCTKYINFLGFFEDDPTPIILSFSKTNMAEGKRMYSMAKVARQNIWNFGYTLASKEKAKNGNSWYIIDPQAAGATSDENRAIGMELYQQFAKVVTSINNDAMEAAQEVTIEVDTSNDNEF